MKKMDVLVDLQFGSTGKGALAGYIGARNGYTAVVSCNMPNAGHTAYSPDSDEAFIHKVLPSAIFGDSLRTIAIGPGAVFSIDRLEEEWKNVCEYREDLTLIIHEAAGILLLAPLCQIRRNIHQCVHIVDKEVVEACWIHCGEHWRFCFRRRFNLTTTSQRGTQCLCARKQACAVRQHHLFMVFNQMEAITDFIHHFCKQINEIITHLDLDEHAQPPPRLARAPVQLRGQPG